MLQQPMKEKLYALKLQGMAKRWSIRNRMKPLGS